MYCGPIVFEVVMKDGSAIDTEVFSFDDDANPQQLSIYTEDATKYGTFDFTVKLTTPDYTDNAGAERDFSILIKEDDRCFKDNIIIMPSMALAAEN